MYFKSALLAAVAAIVGLTIAIPTATSQGPASIEICSGQNFEGLCANVWTPAGACVEFPVGFHDDVGSIDVLENESCNLYYDNNCTTTSYNIGAGKHATLPVGTDLFNSVTCTPN
ncbi:hypothetical protein NM688_g1716 [Phlebia brevispora]|uniref:Uncharacterized protein n=1 Tax=Phlebia brevispora TaxID=194682 RepID=A0ACC1TAW5_9APHY|nr:hypothetical protein NM688_g1716 [Phlebia brevispora]